MRPQGKSRYLLAVISAIILLLCRATSCIQKDNCPDGAHETFTIVNNSDRPINWQTEDSQDSVWTQNGSTFPSLADRYIAPHSTYYVGAGRARCWERSYLEHNSFYFFLFDADSVKTLGWQAINGTDRGSLKKVRVNIDHLKANNFSITYP